MGLEMAIYTSSSLSTGKIQLHCEDPNNKSSLHFPPLPFPSYPNSHVVTQKPNIVFIQSKKLLILKEYFIFTENIYIFKTIQEFTKYGNYL